MNKNIFLIAIIAFFSTSCTIYTERQSKELSRTVYATKDSLENARVDLAIDYSAQAARIVKPPKPKDRIAIDAVYEKKVSSIPVVATSAAPKQPISANKQRILIVPEIYKNDTVVVVNSKEYQQLLQDKQIYEQLKSDFKKLEKVKSEVDKELEKQATNRNKMIEDLNLMQRKLVEKDLAILQRNVIIVVLLSLICGATYLRMKGIL